MIPGHEEGDRALIAIADLMKAAFRESDILARQGGDEFIILFANTSRHDAATAMETLSHNVARFNQQAANPWQLAFSWGCVEYDPASHPSLNALVATADRLMYQRRSRSRTRAPLILCGGGIQQILLRLLPLLRIAAEQRLLRFPSLS